MAYEKVEYLAHNKENDPELEGWYIVYYEDDGYSYDAIGPYDTKEIAIEILNEAKDFEL